MSEPASGQPTVSSRKSPGEHTAGAYTLLAALVGGLFAIAAAIVSTMPAEEEPAAELMIEIPGGEFIRTYYETNESDQWRSNDPTISFAGTATGATPIHVTALSFVVTGVKKIDPPSEEEIESNSRVGSPGDGTLFLINPKVGKKYACPVSAGNVSGAWNPSTSWILEVGAFLSRDGDGYAEGDTVAVRGDLTLEAVEGKKSLGEVELVFLEVNTPH